MALTIASKMAADGGSIYYSPDWLDNVELHLPYLLRQASNQTLPLLDVDAIKYQFDFYGLLRAYSQPPPLHYPILRMNGLHAPTDYDGSLTSIIVPSRQVITSLVTVWQAITQRAKKIA